MKRFSLASAVLAVVMATQGHAAEPNLYPAKVGTIDELNAITDFCGTKPIKVAYSSGISSDPWRKISRREFELEAAKCKTITDVRYTDAQGSVEKQISDITGLAAQGFDVIIVYPDGGESLLRAMSQATKMGAKVVPFYGGTSYPGKAGKDYVAMITNDQGLEGKMAAEWIVKALKGEGNIIYLGGAAGATSVKSHFDGAMSVFKDHPGIKLLEPGPITTNWDRAQEQKIMTSLLAKHPKIDAVMSDYGIGSMGALRAFEIAGRSIPLWTTRDGNELACFWYSHKDANPNFQLFTTSAGTWLTRIALRKGVAAAEGFDNDEPSIFHDPVVDDTTSSDPKLKPVCDPDLPPGAHVSTFTMTKAELQDVFK